jgi:hypothetical protein
MSRFVSRTFGSSPVAQLLTVLSPNGQASKVITMLAIVNVDLLSGLAPLLKPKNII